MWSNLAGSEVSTSLRAQIQQASRTVVLDLMGPETVYWEIDFSAERHQRSFLIYSRALTSIEGAERRVESTLRESFCASDVDLRSSDFVLSLLYRVGRERGLAASLGLKSTDADIVSACLPSDLDDHIDYSTLVQEWLESCNDWDRRIKGLTPDQPEYVASSFMSVWRRSSFLPRYIKNISMLVEQNELSSFMGRFARGIQAAFPVESGLKLPAAMTP